MRNLLHRLLPLREATTACLPRAAVLAAIGSFLLQLIGLLLQIHGR